MLQEISTNLFHMSEPWPEKVIRSIAVYLFLLIVLRIAGKREMGQVTTSDLIVILLLSNTVQNAIIGNETSLIGGLAGATILIIINKVVARICYRSVPLRRVMYGAPLALIRGGKVDYDALKSQEISLDEMEAAGRINNVASVGDIREAILETNGTISVIPRSTGSDDDIGERLERIENMLKRLVDSPAPTEGASAT